MTKLAELASKIFLIRTSRAERAQMAMFAAWCWIFWAAFCNVESTRTGSTMVKNHSLIITNDYETVPNTSFTKSFNFMLYAQFG